MSDEIALGKAWLREPYPRQPLGSAVSDARAHWGTKPGPMRYWFSINVLAAAHGRRYVRLMCLLIIDGSRNTRYQVSEVFEVRAFAFQSLQFRPAPRPLAHDAGLVGEGG